MIRAAIGAGTPVGLKVKDLVSKGALVSDEIVLEMIADRIQVGLATGCSPSYSAATWFPSVR